MTNIVLLLLLLKTIVTIIGHVPRTISVTYDLFLKKEGTILCVLTGPPQYSRDLVKATPRSAEVSDTFVTIVRCRINQCKS